MVLPKQRYTNIFDIEPHKLEKLIPVAKTVASKLRDRLQEGGVNMLHASG